MDDNVKKGKNYRLIIIMTVSVLILCLMLMYFSELSLTIGAGAVAIFSAVIGVVLTVVVTNSLLNKQTENEESKEKSLKVFEEKLKIYQAFLAKLHDIIKDGKIDNDEARELIFQISYIRMHTHAEKVISLLGAIQDTVGSIGPDKSLSDLAGNIMEISKIMQQELYGEPLGELSKEDMKLFNNLVTEIEGNVETNAAIELESDRNLITQFEDKLEIALKNGGIDLSVWGCEKGGKSAPFLILRKTENGITRHIGLTQEDKYNAYFFAQTNNIEMSVSMKHAFGGRRNGGGWWVALKEPYSQYYTVLSQYINDNAIFEYLSDVIFQACQYLDMCFLWDKVNSNWIESRSSGSLRIWKTHCLVVDYCENKYSSIITDFAIDTMLANQKWEISLVSRGDNAEDAILKSVIEKFYPTSINSEGRYRIATFDSDKQTEVVATLNILRKQILEFLNNE